MGFKEAVEYIRTLICPQDDLTKKIEDLKVVIKERNTEIGALKEEVKNKTAEFMKNLDTYDVKLGQLDSAIVKLQGELDDANQQLNKYEKLDELQKIADKLNARHAIVNLTYTGRVFPNSSNKMDVPIQLFIDTNDPVIKKDVKDYGLEVSNQFVCNDKILEIYKFTRNNPRNPYRYEQDSANIGIPEFWLFPFELRFAGKGDCDDWGNELASYLLTSGVPSFRVRCVAGNCRGYNGTGHLTVYVLGDDLKTWYHVNSTTPPSMLTAIKKLESLPNSQDDKDLIGIKNVWFSYNNEYCWSDFEGTSTDKDNLTKIFKFEKAKK